MRIHIVLKFCEGGINDFSKYESYSIHSWGKRSIHTSHKWLQLTQREFELGSLISHLEPLSTHTSNLSRSNKLSALVVYRNRCDHNFDVKNIVWIKRESNLLRQICIESALISGSSDKFTPRIIPHIFFLTKLLQCGVIKNSDNFFNVMGVSLRLYKISTFHFKAVRLCMMDSVNKAIINKSFIKTFALCDWLEQQLSTFVYL